MKKIKLTIFFLVLFSAGMVIPAVAAEFQFHGDMNNRFLLYTNHYDWLSSEQQGEINDATADKFYGELKYRFWAEAATDDNRIKGVYGIEIGGVRFGRTGTGRSQGGSYSGDGANLETRWAYVDFQLPFVESKARTLVGLQPFSVNRYFWQETAAGVNFKASPADRIDYQLAWMRGVDVGNRNPDSGIEDVDGFYANLNFKPMDKTNIGIFGVYQTGDANSPTVGTINPRTYELKSFAGNVKHRLYTLGVDGKFDSGPFYLGWNLMYQGGDIDRATWDDTEFSGVTKTGDFNLNAYFANLDVGTRIDKINLMYRFWYASGDDDPADGDINAFFSTDVDVDDGIGIFEGLYTDDDYFSERPYILDKGFIMNRLSADFPVTDKSTLGLVLMYMLTAEDIKYTDALGRSQSNNEIGFELDAYWRYMLYKNLELSINAGYLLAGDAMDAFEVGALRDGNADEDIFGSSMRIRYKF